MALFKSLSKIFSSGKRDPVAYLAAFGKHPGWNDHLDDLGLDTDPLVNAKRLLYVQGISQNIDSGAWANLEPDERLDDFQHDFLWHMPSDDGITLLAGRLWSSADGKGRDKYPMVVCAQLDALSESFATQTVLPFLSRVQQQCEAATTAGTVQNLIAHERDSLRSRIADVPPAAPLTARQVAAVANHADMQGLREGFHRIIYQFVRALSAYRSPAGKKDLARRPEQLRLPDGGLSPADSLLFWFLLASSFVDESTPMLLIAPDPAILKKVGGFGGAGTGEAWVDLIVGEPAPANFFCIKAGPKQLPLTSEIPYTLDPSLTRAIDTHINHCASMPQGAPMPAWPQFD